MLIQHCGGSPSGASCWRGGDMQGCSCPAWGMSACSHRVDEDVGLSTDDLLKLPARMSKDEKKILHEQLKKDQEGEVFEIFGRSSTPERSMMKRPQQRKVRSGTQPPCKRHQTSRTPTRSIAIVAASMNVGSNAHYAKTASCAGSSTIPR